VSGQNGHGQMIKVAIEIGPGFDLHPDVAYRLLLAEYNPRCEPPWSERDLRRKVDEAYRIEPHRGWHLNGDSRNGSNGSHGKGSGVSRGVGTLPPPAAPPPANATVAIAEPIRPNEATDDPHRLARLFARRKARHTDGWTLRYWLGEWHRWDGTAYRTFTEKEIRAELTQVIKAEFNRVNGKLIKDHAEPDEPPPTVRPVTTKLVGNVIQALAGITLLGSRKCRSQPAWLDDSEPPFPAAEILPVRNGLIHVPGAAAGRRILYPPTPRFFCPYALDYDFAADAPEPVNWLTFLGARPITPGGPIRHQLWPDDAQARDALQEWFGLNLLADTRYQKICAIIGPRRCGKGTIARVLTAMVGGENVANPTLSSLGTNFGLAPLIGKLAAIITDARISRQADIAQVVERLLSISGEDGQTIDRKHQTAWTGRLAARFTLISNEIPRLADTSTALAGRMVLLRLTEDFYGVEDEWLMEKLLPERPGILLWAIEGWKRLRDRGRFVQPESGEPLVKEMEEAASPVSVFLEERCNVGPSCSVKVEELFTDWQVWCKRKNRQAVGDESTFGRYLRAVIPKLHLTKHHPGGQWFRVYHGVELKLEPPAF
jgi:putative DNA primase/helicase